MGGSRGVASAGADLQRLGHGGRAVRLTMLAGRRWLGHLLHAGELARGRNLAGGKVRRVNELAQAQVIVPLQPAGMGWQP